MQKDSPVKSSNSPAVILILIGGDGDAWETTPEPRRGRHSLKGTNFGGGRAWRDTRSAGSDRLAREKTTTIHVSRRARKGK